MFSRSRTYRPSFWARLFLVDNWRLTLNPKRTGVIELGEHEIASMDLVSIGIEKALLWHAVEIRTKSGVSALSGLSGDGARRLRTDLLRHVNIHFAELIDEDSGALRLVDEAIGDIVRAKRQYLAYSDIARAIANVPGSAARALSHPLFDRSLMPASVQGLLPMSFDMLTDPEARRQYNDAFVAHELDAYATFFDQVGKISLSDEQRQACVRLEDSNLLVASAGSGKSATMVGKVAYVLAKGLYQPEEILVLAFNKSAADELAERIAAQLGVTAKELGCKVTTFHALGRGIIQQVEGRPPQLANWIESPAGEARFINDIVTELAETDEDFRSLWLDLLSLHPKADIPVQEFDSIAEYERYITDTNSKGGTKILTLSGLYVRSLQEQQIANWLWRHSVDFEYEFQVPVPDPGGGVRYLHPDFYYPATSTIHEHFAIDADGTSPFPDYVEHAELKRAGYVRMESDFFETTSAQAADGTLLRKLGNELANRGIPIAERPMEEVLKKVPDVVLAHYEKIIAVCIKHIRASNLTLEILLEKAKSLHDKQRAERFAKAIWRITQTYGRKLEESRRIDFDSMIGDAVRLVETGRYRNPYSLIMVDEFQDISDPRAKLIKALKFQKPFTKLFAVGDDWQSIYRFTGSDITIFTQFEENFGAAWQGRLQQTYRSNQRLAETAAAFIQRNPAQLKKVVRSSRPAIRGSIRAIPIRTSKGEPSFQDACHQLLERLDSFLDGKAAQWKQQEGQKLHVLVLWRYNRLNPFRDRPPMFRNIEVKGLSFHRSKGLEADYTILLDISEGDYGVPSRIEDDELLHLVIPRPETFPYAEERRLFYVALTRASRGTFMLYDASKPSRYIKELCEIAGKDVRFETVAGSPLAQCPRCITGKLVERRSASGEMHRACSASPACGHVEAALNKATSASRLTG